MDEALPPSATAPAAVHRTCRSCGTTVPTTEAVCAICSRTETAPAGSGWQTVRHWIVLLALMAALFAGGLYFAPG